MQIDQILVRPSSSTVIVQYNDLVGNRLSLVFESTGNQTVSALIADCQQRLPTDSANPAKAEIEKEISTLESRLVQLKSAIGAA